jgi:hypothetical protein
MARPRATLLDLVVDQTWRISRHEGLLASDDSLLRWVLDETEDPDKRLSGLADLVLHYRAADGPLKRREAALAFAALARRGDWWAHHRLMTDERGADFVWGWDPAEETFELYWCVCRACMLKRGSRELPKEIEIFATVDPGDWRPAPELVNQGKASWLDEEWPEYAEARAA